MLKMEAFLGHCDDYPQSQHFTATGNLFSIKWLQKDDINKAIGSSRLQTQHDDYWQSDKILFVGSNDPLQDSPTTECDGGAATASQHEGSCHFLSDFLY